MTEEEKSERNRELANDPISPFLLMIPATLDFTASTISLFALTQVAASVYQMVRGFIIVVTAGLARAFLKKPQYRHHIVGIILIFVGEALVGLASIVYGTDNDSTEVTFFVMLLIAKTLTGCQFVAEEWLLRDYDVDALKVVGLEGMWGSIYWIIILPILNIIHVPESTLFPRGVVEDSIFAL